MSQKRHDDLTMGQRRALMQVKIQNDIEKHGCFCMGVFGSEHRPPWTYSIGITTTVPGAAEIMVYGLDPENAAGIINIILEQMKEGRAFEAGKEYDGILQDLSVYFGRVEKQHYDDHFGQSQIYHKSRADFPVFQLVWPDESGKFPWQDGFEEKLREAQPLLFAGGANE